MSDGVDGPSSAALRPVSSPASLGAYVRNARRARGWTQANLADEAGVGRRFVIELEGGKSTAALGLTLRTLGALGLDVTVGPSTASGRAGRTGRVSLDQVLDGLA